MDDPKQLYASYNVLARKALVFGVPIITLVILLILTLVTAALGIITLGFFKGIIAPIICVGTLFVIRVMCMDDSRAMEDVYWNARGLLSRLKCRSNVISYSSDDGTVTRRRETINDFFKNVNA